MPLSLYVRPLSNTGFHNLCTHTQPPPGTAGLLGYSLKYCIQKPLPAPDISASIKRFTKDIRTAFAVADFEPSESNDIEYIPKLYIKSDSWRPPQAPLLVEDAIHTFHEHLLQAALANRNFRRYNLNFQHRKLLQELRSSRQFIIVPTDKNLGPAIMNRDTYKTRALQDHLLDASSYQQLSPTDAQALRLKTRQDLLSLVEQHKETLSATDTRYFDRSFAIQDKRLPQFGLMPKVHKKTVPIPQPQTSCQMCWQHS